MEKSVTNIWVYGRIENFSPDKKKFYETSEKDKELLRESTHKMRPEVGIRRPVSRKN